MSSLLALPWLPEAFADRVLFALNAPSCDYTGYLTRMDALRALFQDLTKRLLADGEYGDNVIWEAFNRSHDEPGQAWNMDQWNMKHLERSAERRPTADWSRPG
jgi:hypothetical protein